MSYSFFFSSVCSFIAIFKSSPGEIDIIVAPTDFKFGYYIIKTFSSWVFSARSISITVIFMPASLRYIRLSNPFALMECVIINIEFTWEMAESSSRKKAQRKKKS